MSTKVIYVGDAHLNEKLERDWYINYLRAQNVTVEYWDILSLLHGEIEEFGSKNADYLRMPKTNEALEAMLRKPENNGAYYVLLVNYTGYSTTVFRLFSKNNCKMIYINWGAMPVRSIQKWKGLLSGFSDPLELVKKIFYKLKAIAYRKLKLVKPFDIMFAAGHVLLARKLDAVKVVPINLIDYDHFKEAILEDRRYVAGRYAVFLDIYLPYQSDLKIVGMDAVNPEFYYASLNRFFELLESKYGIKVVIAAHPKANYSAELFNGRAIYQGQTPALVKDADFVISHHSTAISYVVLNYKPVIFIYTNEMAAIYRYTIVSTLSDFAKYLDAAVYNIDKIIRSEQISVKDVNREFYDNYKYNYLTTHESEHLLTRDVFWREITMNK